MRKAKMYHGTLAGRCFHEVVDCPALRGRKNIYHDALKPLLKWLGGTRRACKRCRGMR